MKLAAYFAYIWCALSVVSLICYAFTGQTVWAPLDPKGDGLARFILLFMLHIGGIVSPAVLDIREEEA